MTATSAKSFEDIKIGDTLGPQEIHVSRERCRAYAREAHLEQRALPTTKVPAKKVCPG